MTRIEQATIESIAGATSHISDRHKQLAALSYAKSRNIPQSEAFKIIFDKRLSWLNWLSITQREWQEKTKNVNKARFNDSISIREKYVTCHL